ncbi:hypothetical protein T07_5523 [Trichinella nelsoni]|uniref:Uncharacterized protein n=1 Tax=Trichinella nelsoni TaxID=6336 RepID=A0A0V0SIF2_9BILA|nr:hypothetical protein T07_5523 [Trichinella nelsoni]
MEEERQYPLVKGRKRTILLFPLFFHQDGIRSPRSPKERIGQEVARQLEVDNAIEQVNCVHQKRLIEKPNAAPSRGVIVNTTVSGQARTTSNTCSASHLSYNTGVGQLVNSWSAFHDGNRISKQFFLQFRRPLSVNDPIISTVTVQLTVCREIFAQKKKITSTCCATPTPIESWAIRSASPVLHQ